MPSRWLNPLSSIDAEIAQRLERDVQFRRRFIRLWAQNEVASEIRRLRKKRRLNQGEVAELARTGQSAISRIEKADYDGWTFKTLIGIAEVLDARLRITFEPIEEVAKGYRNTDGTAAEMRFLDGKGTGKEAKHQGGSETPPWHSVTDAQATARNAQLIR